jgi:hypothetical protein
MEGGLQFVNLMQEFVQTLIVYSVLSTFCMHLMPAKKYLGYASFTVGLVYICMILDMLQQVIAVWNRS